MNTHNYELPSDVPFEINSFIQYTDELRANLFNERSTEWILEKATVGHRAFRVLTMIIVKHGTIDELLRSYPEYTAVINRAVIALRLFTEYDRADISYRKAVYEQIKDIEIDTENCQSLEFMDVPNVWKDICNYRMVIWKKNLLVSKKARFNEVTGNLFIPCRILGSNA